jgi:hypothetical protein
VVIGGVSLRHPSISLVDAGASGFLTLIQSGERPYRSGRPRRLATMPGAELSNPVLN